ncbi:MAG: MBOAT family protein, partial [Pseudomonadota bacterium]
VYVTFFPAIAAGPIDRAGKFLPQLQRDRPFEEGNFTGGCKLLLWGFFKKFVIAERIAALVTPVFSQPQAQPGLTLLMA